MPEQIVFGKFRVRLRKVVTPLPPPAEGSSTTYIFPEPLNNLEVRSGVLSVNPADDADVILAVTGPQSVLERLRSTEGVTMLSEHDAEALMQEWRVHA